jgi:hypothetical protein
MHTDETDDLGDAPPMPPEGTCVRIREDEAAAVARQTLDSTPADDPAVRMLAKALVGMTGAVARAAHTNGDIQPDRPIAIGRPIFAYGAQVEEIEA